jgi:hypothetical protein
MHHFFRRKSIALISKVQCDDAVRDVSFREAAIIVICVTMGMVGGLGRLLYLVQLM